MNDMAPGNPSVAVTPVGLNHLVLNVRDIEASHRFWTEMLGFRQVGEVPPGLGGVRRGAMRFYSGVRDGGMHHHDIALVDTPDLAQPSGPHPIGHVAIALADREVLAAAAGVPAEQGRAVRAPRRTRHDAQPLYPRSQRLQRRASVRAAARDVGGRHQRGAEPLRGAADGRNRGAGGSGRVSGVRKIGGEPGSRSGIRHRSGGAADEPGAGAARRRLSGTNLPIEGGNVAEEIEALGKSQGRGPASRIRTVLVHLLKLGLAGSRAPVGAKRSSSSAARSSG